jgi:signal transduction histidine kinase
VVPHARRRLRDSGGLAGGVHVFLADDFGDLPFLPARGADAALYRGAPAQSRGRQVDLVVYERAGGVRFSSFERPPALTAALRARAQAEPEGFWTTVAVDGRAHHTFVFSDAQAVYALAYPRRGASRFAADLAEAAAAPALWALVALLVLMGVRTLLRREGLTLPALGAGVRRRFALRLFAAFVGVALVPVAVLQGVVARFVRERLLRAAEDQALERASVARKAVEDFVFYQRQGLGPSAPEVTDAALVWIASLVRNELDVFADGRLLASSQRALYASGLLPARVPGPVFRELALEGRPRALSTEALGEVRLRVVSVPVRLGEGRAGILRVPLELRERELRAVLDDLERISRLASLAFLLAGAALAQSLARRIAGPLGELTAATRRVAAGDLETRVEPRSRDELRELVEAFNQMAADLRRQRADLERSNRLAAWAEMARQVAHEVKNPLTPIQLSAEHLRRVWRDPGADFAQALEACTGTILRQVRSLRDMVTEFSAFARPPVGAPARLDLAALLRDVLRSYETLPPGVELHGELPRNGAYVRGEDRLLARALVNLVENALQALDGHGRLEVRLIVDEGASRAQIEVEDTGPGIAPELHARIFEPFFSTKTGGSGLGLALVRKIAEEHGGGVTLESRPGRTCARLWLPLDSERSAAGEDAPTDLSADRPRTGGS